MGDFLAPLPSSAALRWVYTAVLCVLVYFVVDAIRAYQRLRHFPGPPLAAWSSLWYLRATTSGKAHLVYGDVCAKYGPLVRIGPNMLITCDEELYRKMSSIRSPYRRSDWFKAFRFDADRENVLSETNEEKHTQMRKRISSGYSGKENPNLESDMDRVIWNLINLLRDKYISKGSHLKRLDFAQVMQFLTLDVITSLALGEPFGYVSNDKDMYSYVETTLANFPAMNFMAAVPILSRIMRVPAIQRAALPTVKDRVGMGKVKAIARGIISQRFGPEKVIREDMTQSFIRHGLSQAEIADESLLQILAGSDTTATILRAGFVYIASNPCIYRRLQDECVSAGVPVSEIISNQRALELPYLQACVKECLRYHPAVTGLFPRIVPPTGHIHNGQFIPPGTEIGMCVWNLQRHNFDAYGEDAHVFRPERWLEAGPERLARMEKAHELVFGYGRYSCLGERIAKIELGKTFFELLRRFDWGFIDAMKSFDFEINYGLFFHKGLWVRVEDRKG